jgi:hypothetical protein
LAARSSGAIWRIALFRGAQEGNTAAVVAEVLIIWAAGESWLSAVHEPINVSSPGNATTLFITLTIPPRLP